MNNQLTVPRIAIQLLVALAIVQAIRTILPPQFDIYLLYFLGFDAFRDGSFWRWAETFELTDLALDLHSL